MSYIRMGGGDQPEVVKEFKMGTINSATIQSGSSSIIPNTMNFTVGETGKMIIDYVVGQGVGSSYSYNFYFRKNGQNIQTGTYNKSGRWYYHLELDVNAGDKFTWTTSESGGVYASNCGMWAIVYKII